MDVRPLAKYARERFKEADDAFSSYEGYLSHMPHDDVRDLYEELFVSSVHGLRVAILAALEALALPKSREDFESALGKFTDLSVVNMAPHNMVLYSPVIELARDYVAMIEAAVGANTVDREDRERERLEQMLASTAVLIHEQKLNPANELQVQAAMYSTLRAVFPDTVRDVPIATVTKTYKPDFGVRSLRAAVEYKFCASQDEVGKALGGIYEDIHGYGGSRDWEWFYAVLYLTEPFIAPQHAEAEFKIGGVPKHWKPIVVVGSGKRRARKAAAKVAKKVKPVRNTKRGR